MDSFKQQKLQTDQQKLSIMAADLVSAAALMILLALLRR